MKYIISVLILSVLSITILHCNLITVNIDGSADFTEIMPAIETSADGDTVLVYPGVYTGDLDFLGKNITLTSLYGYFDNNRNLITETIIDGNYEVRCIAFQSGETRQAILNGFTITRGYGGLDGDRTSGGGILIQNDASPTISNCIIEHNQAHTGSGILVYLTGNPLLKGNTIRYNHSFKAGAVGVGGVGPANAEFCQDELNSVYLNYGTDGTDFSVRSESQSPIVLDTMTVPYPCPYFAQIFYKVENFSITANNYMIEPVAADLFVSPEGCDLNSGLTPDDPLQTIAMAMLKIAPDENITYTVHVAAGIYSKSLNNQYFPIRPRSNVNIIGESKETTVLDAEEKFWFFYDFPPHTYLYPSVTDITLKNFTLINGNTIRYKRSGSFPGAMRLRPVENFTIENISIINAISYMDLTIALGFANNGYIKNLEILDSAGGRAIIAKNWEDFFYCYFENIRINNFTNTSFVYPYYYNGYGRTFGLSANWIWPQPFRNADIVNMEITNNLMDEVNWPASGDFGSITLNYNAWGRMINCTLGDITINRQDAGAIVLIQESKLELYNTILYNTEPTAIRLAWPHYLDNHPCELLVSHSLIEGGYHGIYNPQNVHTIIWEDGNLDTDPLWIGENDEGLNPYYLSMLSPAINAGTLDIPDFEFPEYDLAGNPRIYGSSIDMGAYEWNPELNTQEEYSTFDTPGFDYKLRNFPNPVTRLQKNQRGPGTGTTISFKIPFEGHVALDIYNLKGQHIRRIMDGYSHNGEFNAFWDGRDSRDNLVSTGFYMYQLKFNGDVVASGKCTFIK